MAINDFENRTYSDLTQYETWLTENGLTDTRTDDEKEVGLYQGSKYLDQVYGDAYVGYPNSDNVERLWPRTGGFDQCKMVVIPSDEIPIYLTDSASYICYTTITNPIWGNPSNSVAGDISRAKLDVMEVEYEEGTQGQAGSGTKYPRVDRLLYCILEYNPNSCYLNASLS